MGAGLARACARARDATSRGAVSVEFSLASIFPSHSRNLRGRSAANLAGYGVDSPMAGLIDTGYNSARTRYLDSPNDVDLSNGRPLCFSVDLDFAWARGALVFFGASFTQFRTWRMGTGGDHISRVSFDIFLHPAELRCPEIQSVARTH